MYSPSMNRTSASGRASGYWFHRGHPEANHEVRRRISIFNICQVLDETPSHHHAILNMGCGHRMRIGGRTADVQTFIFCIRSRKYSFQSSGKAAICKARRKDASSSVPHRFKTYNRVISETDTAFASREITVIASPTPTSPSRVTAK